MERRRELSRVLLYFIGIMNLDINLGRQHLVKFQTHLNNI
jgi:hypothetical protein